MIMIITYEFLETVQNQEICTFQNRPLIQKK